jgi:hypothetical protein
MIGRVPKQPVRRRVDAYLIDVAGDVAEPKVFLDPPTPR